MSEQPRGTHWVEGCAQDLRLAVRRLRRNPTFAITAAATLGLGIGAATAVFSVADAILLRPLPYKHPDQLVLMLRDMPQRGVRDFPFSNADFFDFRGGTRAMFSDVAAIDVNPGRTLVQGDNGAAQEISYTSVTPNFLRVLGAATALGRDFEENDGQPQQSSSGSPERRLPLMAILSYEYWQRRYGGDPSVLGREIPGTGARIIGVAARAFELLLPPRLGMERTPDVWFAARLGYDNARRLNAHLRVLGRLRDGVTLERAQAAADVVAADLRSKISIKANSGDSIRLQRMGRYLVAEVQPALLAVAGAGLFLLLIACANVANLWLVEVSLQEREVAVRRALGASAGRVARQNLAEAGLVAAIGAVLGVAWAWAGVRYLLVLSPPNLPRLATVRMDPRVLAFSAAAGAVAAVVFGMAPAAGWWRPGIMQVLRAAGRPAGLAAGGRIRNLVVIAQVALTFVLLAGSGLMFRSFLALQKVNPGFEARGLLTFQLLGERSRIPAQRAAAMREVQGRLRSLPWVRNAAAARALPLDGVFYPARWSSEQEPAAASRVQASADLQVVLPGFFETFETPLVAGRTFTDADNAPERNVAVIDQALANQAFPRQPAVGKRIQILLRGPDPEWVEIIGVVAHQRSTGLAEEGREQLYLTTGYIGHETLTQWAIRTPGDPARYVGSLRSEMAKIDPRLLVTQVRPMEALLDRSRAPTRFSLLLIAGFAATAMLLAAIGIYGVLSTVVRQRTAEIGVRMALGATPASVFQLVVGRGLRLSAQGLAAGVLAGFFLTRMLASLLVGVQPADPLTFAVMTVFFLSITAVVCWLPARRAARLDPAVVLREE